MIPLFAAIDGYNGLHSKASTFDAWLFLWLVCLPLTSWFPPTILLQRQPPIMEPSTSRSSRDFITLASARKSSVAGVVAALPTSSIHVCPWRCGYSACSSYPGRLPI
ncbi:hypothetical protein BDZ89DRAFT_157762 [Hymenopellis radicata]|nr:hypothetical protein BDZ89DRAFT_157762 [Hymenopellis radicata]